MARNDIFELNGLTDLQKKIEFVAKQYPYESEDLLQKMGNKFRNSVKEKTPESKRAKRKKLIKSYKLSKVKGAGKDLWIEFGATSPHFHLVERGHRIVVGRKLSTRKDTGKRVEGKFMVKRTVKEFQTEYPEEVEKMVNRIVRKLL